MKFITIYIREIVIILIKIIHCTHHTKNTYSKIIFSQSSWYHEDANEEEVNTN